MNTPETIGDLLRAVIEPDPTRPQLTFYDDHTGERVELSGATLANWVAKTANLIVDGCGLGPGDRATVGLPPHWQTSAVLLASWSAGLSVSLEPAPADIAFVHIEQVSREWPAADRYALNLHPLALPLGTVPNGYSDFNSEVRLYGDHFRPLSPPSPGEGALVRPAGTIGQSELLSEATETASRFGIDGGRVLVDADRYPDPIVWLLAPMVAGATVVLSRRSDPLRLETRAGAERVTHRLI